MYALCVDNMDLFFYCVGEKMEEKKKIPRARGPQQVITTSVIFWFFWNDVFNCEFYILSNIL